MKKKDKKGFVLVESIVAAIFVMAFSTFLIVNLVPLVGEYEQSLNYDTVDSKYNAHMIRKMLLTDDTCRIGHILDMSLVPSGKPKFYYFQGSEICDYLVNENYCRKLLSSDFLDVNEIVITEFTGSSLKSASDDYKYEFSNPLQDYIKFMPTYGSNAISYYSVTGRLIVTFNDGGVTNIEILKNYVSGCM